MAKNRVCLFCGNSNLIDILTFLTGISSRDGEKFPVLRKAVRSVTQSDSRGLL